MKNTTRRVVLGAATLAAIALVGQDAAHAATTALPMKAKIIQAVKITQTASLNFGTITHTAAGKVIVDDGDTRSKTGGVTLVGGTAAQTGRYKIKGANGINIVVTAPTKDTVKTGGGSSLQVDNFTFGGGAGSFVGKITAGTTKKSLPVGATLNVTALAPTGTYNGTVTLTANYQ